MGELIVLKGAVCREVCGSSTAPMRQPGFAGAGYPASQCERLGEVVQRVLEGLTVSETDRLITKS